MDGMEDELDFEIDEDEVGCLLDSINPTSDANQPNDSSSEKEVVSKAVAIETITFKTNSLKLYGFEHVINVCGDGNGVGRFDCILCTNSKLMSEMELKRHATAPSHLKAALEIYDFKKYQQCQFVEDCTVLLAALEKLLDGKCEIEIPKIVGLVETEKVKVKMAEEISSKRKVAREVFHAEIGKNNTVSSSNNYVKPKESSLKSGKTTSKTIVTSTAKVLDAIKTKPEKLSNIVLSFEGSEPPKSLSDRLKSRLSMGKTPDRKDNSQTEPKINSSEILKEISPKVKENGNAMSVSEFMSEIDNKAANKKQIKRVLVDNSGNLWTKKSKIEMSAVPKKVDDDSKPKTNPPLLDKFFKPLQTNDNKTQTPADKDIATKSKEISLQMKDNETDPNKKNVTTTDVEPAEPEFKFANITTNSSVLKGKAEVLFMNKKTLHIRGRYSPLTQQFLVKYFGQLRGGSTSLVYIEDFCWGYSPKFPDSAAIAVLQLDNLRLLDTTLSVKYYDVKCSPIKYETRRYKIAMGGRNNMLNKYFKETFDSIDLDMEKDLNILLHKTVKCPSVSCTDKKCVSVHGNEQPRRDPRLIKYSGVMCKDAKSNCVHGEECLYAHNENEVKFHPDNYLKNICTDLDQDGNCVKYMQCGNAHRGTYDFFYQEEWKNLYLYGLEKPAKLLMGAVLNTFKILGKMELDVHKGKREGIIKPLVLFISPNEEIAKSCRALVLKLVGTRKIKIAPIGTNVIGDVIIGTPDMIFNYMPDTFNSVGAIIIDNVTAMLENAKLAKDLNKILLGVKPNPKVHGKINFVLTTERQITDLEIKIASKIFKTTFYTNYSMSNSIEKGVQSRNKIAMKSNVLEKMIPSTPVVSKAVEGKTPAASPVLDSTTETNSSRINHDWRSHLKSLFMKSENESSPEVKPEILQAKTGSPSVTKPVTPTLAKTVTPSVVKPVTPSMAKSVTPSMAKRVSPYLTKPATPFSTKPATPFSAKPATPFSAKPATPFSAKPATPFSAKLASPFSAKPASPFSAKPASPFSAKPASPFSAKPASPFSAKPASPFSAKPASPFSAKPTTLFSAKTTTSSPSELGTSSLTKMAELLLSKPAELAKQSSQAKTGQQFQPKAGQQFQPKAGQQFQPKAGQQFQPKAGQQFKSDTDYRIRPENDQKFRSDTDQRFRSVSSPRFPNNQDRSCQFTKTNASQEKGTNNGSIQPLMNINTGIKSFDANRSSPMANQNKTSNLPIGKVNKPYSRPVDDANAKRPVIHDWKSHLSQLQQKTPFGGSVQSGNSTQLNTKKLDNPVHGSNRLAASMGDFLRYRHQGDKEGGESALVGNNGSQKKFGLDAKFGHDDSSSHANKVEPLAKRSKFSSNVPVQNVNYSGSASGGHNFQENITKGFKGNGKQGYNNNYNQQKVGSLKSDFKNPYAQSYNKIDNSYKNSLGNNHHSANKPGIVPEEKFQANKLMALAGYKNVSNSNNFGSNTSKPGKFSNPATFENRNVTPQSNFQKQESTSKWLKSKPMQKEENVDDDVNSWHRLPSKSNVGNEWNQSGFKEQQHRQPWNKKNIESDSPVSRFSPKKSGFSPGESLIQQPGKSTWHLSPPVPPFQKTSNPSMNTNEKLDSVKDRSEQTRHSSFMPKSPVNFTKPKDFESNHMETPTGCKTNKQSLQYKNDDRLPGSRDGFNARQPGSPAGFKAHQPGPQAGYNDRQPGPKGGYNDRQPGPKSGFNTRQPGPKDGFNAHQPGPRDGFNAQQPGPRDGFNAQQPGLKGGFNAQQPGLKGRFNAHQPGPKGGFNAHQPGPKGGFNAQQPGPKGGFNAQQPGPKGGFNAQQPGPKGGSNAQEPGPQGGFNDRQPGPQGGFNAQQPGPQGGFSDRQPGPQGGFSDRQPGPQGGFNDRHPEPQSGFNARQPEPQGGFNARQLGPQGGFNPGQNGPNTDFDTHLKTANVVTNASQDGPKFESNVNQQAPQTNYNANLTKTQSGYNSDQSGPQTSYNPGQGPQTGYNPGQGPQTGYNPGQGPQTGYNPGQGPQTGYNPGQGPQTGYNPGQGPQTGYNPGQGPQTGYNPGQGPQTGYNSGQGPQTGYNSGQGPQTGYNSGQGPQTGYNSAQGPQTGYNSGQGPQTGYNSGQGPQTGYNSGQGPQTGYNSGQGPQTGYNSGQSPQTGYNSGQSGPQTGYNSGQSGPQTGYNSGQSGPQNSYNSGQGPQTGYNSGQGPQTGYNSGQGPQTGYNSGQGPQTGYNSGQGPQTGYNSGQGPQTGYNSGQGPQTGYNSGQGPQTGYNSGQGPQTGYNSGQGSQTGYNSGQGPQTGFNSGQSGPQTSYNAGQPGLQVGYNAGQSGPQVGYNAGQSGPQVGYNAGQSGPQVGYNAGQSGPQAGYNAGQPGPQAGYNAGQPGPQTGYNAGQSGPGSDQQPGTFGKWQQGSKSNISNQPNVGSNYQYNNYQPVNPANNSPISSSDFNMVDALSALDDIAFTLDMLKPAIVALIAVARKKGPNTQEGLKLFVAPDHIELMNLCLSSIQEKLTKFPQNAQLQKALSYGQKLLEHCSLKIKGSLSKNKLALDINEIARQTMGCDGKTIMDYIHSTANNEGVQNMSSTDFGEIFFKVTNLQKKML